mmetsp:Transcript_18880/g.38295  ORF Transcript_18880/g.38295 Transcript_18880/m.38295 type:complete len:242 (+) Transcript_18880:308-1033(+)
MTPWNCSRPWRRAAESTASRRSWCTRGSTTRTPRGRRTRRRTGTCAWTYCWRGRGRTARRKPWTRRTPCSYCTRPEAPERRRAWFTPLGDMRSMPLSRRRRRSISRRRICSLALLTAAGSPATLMLCTGLFSMVPRHSSLSQHPCTRMRVGTGTWSTGTRSPSSTPHPLQSDPSCGLATRSLPSMTFRACGSWAAWASPSIRKLGGGTTKMWADRSAQLLTRTGKPKQGATCAPTSLGLLP